ncbi:unnamed protein product [Acidithrix sp. C25]|nr:unnamed protein product [Acidithrix sp. C25]
MQAEVIHNDTTDGCDQVDLERAGIATNVVRLARFLVTPSLFPTLSATGEG